MPTQTDGLSSDVLNAALHGLERKADDRAAHRTSARLARYPCGWTETQRTPAEICGNGHDRISRSFTTGPQATTIKRRNTSANVSGPAQKVCLHEESE